MAPKTITARATVNLHGLRAGESALVDPTDPRVAALLQAELLVDEEPLYTQAAEKPQEPEPASDGPAPADEAPKRTARRTRSENSTET